MFVKAKNFVVEVKSEMQKVTWSTRAELINATVIVLVTIAFLSVFIGIVDIAFSQGLKLILG